MIESLRSWNDELSTEPHPLVGPATWSVGIVTGGGQGTAIVPAACRIQADRRLLPGEDPDAVLAAVVARIDALGLNRDDLRAEITMPMSMPGFETPAGGGFAEGTPARRIRADRRARDGGADLRPRGGEAAHPARVDGMTVPAPYQRVIC